MASSALVPSPPPSPTYRVVKWAFVTPIFRLFLRGRCRGMELVPLNGPLVVVANHGSHLDPPLLGHALPRPVSFMAKAELMLPDQLDQSALLTDLESIAHDILVDIDLKPVE